MRLLVYPKAWRKACKGPPKFNNNRVLNTTFGARCVHPVGQRKCWLFIQMLSCGSVKLRLARNYQNTHTCKQTVPTYRPTRRDCTEIKGNRSCREINKHYLIFQLKSLKWGMTKAWIFGSLFNTVMHARRKIRALCMTAGWRKKAVAVPGLTNGANVDSLLSLPTVVRNLSRCDNSFDFMHVAKFSRENNSPLQPSSSRPW